MARGTYFESFPEIVYGEKVAKNLIARPSILNTVFNSPASFYDYVIKGDLRPDQVAGLYYDDPNMVWLIFLMNKITDPYYDWPLTDRQFNAFIESKYGVTSDSGVYSSGVTIAQAKIIYYKHNTTGTRITSETYTLNATFSKIVAGQYSPVYAWNDHYDQNDAKRKIKLLDKRFASQAKSELKRVMG
jgi:hypothetical protein|tara:strand:+ start:1173 stop:1733 length:561 start_codon:yes stop_codon:yes gene_type:complete